MLGIYLFFLDKDKADGPPGVKIFDAKECFIFFEYLGIYMTSRPLSYFFKEATTSLTQGGRCKV